MTLRRAFSTALMAAFLPCAASADQTQIPNYNTARDSFVYDELYAAGGKTLYCDEDFSDRSGLQVEHVLPASWMKDAAGCSGRTRNQCRAESDRFNFMEADLHNLWPALAAANQARSNFRFAIIGEDTVDDFGGSCDLEVDSEAGLVEPRPEIRGEISRMLLYMVAEYGIALPEGQWELMVSWHCGDNTPSAEELRRNATIAALQGTRNSYIENPALLCTDDENESAGNAQDEVWEECLIKGNINSSSARIYHEPGSPSYDATRIDEDRGERWFCTSAEAEAAGWRAPHS